MAVFTYAPGVVRNELDDLSQKIVQLYRSKRRWEEILTYSAGPSFVDSLRKQAPRYHRMGRGQMFSYSPSIRDDMDFGYDVVSLLKRSSDVINTLIMDPRKLFEKLEENIFPAPINPVEQERVSKKLMVIHSFDQLIVALLQAIQLIPSMAAGPFIQETIDAIEDNYRILATQVGTDIDPKLDANDLSRWRGNVAPFLTASALRTRNPDI